MLCQDGMLDHREDCLPRQDNLVRQAGEDPGDSGIKLLTAAATNNLYKNDDVGGLHLLSLGLKMKSVQLDES